MRRLCDLRVVRAHGERSNRDRIRARINTEFAETSTSPATDLLAFFIDILLPGLADRDCASESRYEGAFEEDQACPYDAVRPFHSLHSATSDELYLELPTPSLCMLGRAWRLTSATTPPAAVHVRYQGRVLAMTGEYTALKTLRQKWERAVFDYRNSVAAAAPHAGTSNRLMIARDSLALSGAVVNGDLLYLATNPVRVGHVIPPHNNRTLGKSVGRELAITAPLVLPPAIPDNAALLVYQRDKAARWEPLQPSVCLGASPVSSSANGVVEAGINLLAFLRFGAVRIASNGQFHEYDGRG